MNKIKVLSLFSGIGAFEKALTRQNIAYELVNYCEIDKYASKAFALIHNVSEDKNLGDITKVNPRDLPSFDMMTWGFPCTDISIAGKQKGLIDEEGNKTRSGLYYDGLRILQTKKPKYSIIENVKNLTQKKFKHQFEQILYDLDVAGYNSYWEVLNAKDYGVPQNRERVFIVSIRKDIDDKSFKFPKGFENNIKLRDILEKQIENKYYLSEDVQKRFKLTNQSNNIIGTTKPEFRTIGQRDLVFNIHGIMGALVATDYKQPKQISVKENYTEHKVRKITPLECFRLMGFDDKDCQVLRDNKISDTQLYKMAGNSIVVNVLEEIFKNLLSAYSANREVKTQYIVS